VPGRLTRPTPACGLGARAVRLALAASLIGLASVAVPGLAGIKECPGAVQHFADGWEQITLPGGFVSSQHALADYGLDPETTDHLIATNGVDITVSPDGGCTWQPSALPQVSSVPDLTGEDANVVRRSITEVRLPGYGDEGWAIGVTNVEVDNTPLTQPVVLASRDGGHTFATAVNGLPRTGEPLSLAPLAGTDWAYLLLRQPGATQDTYTIYETRDGGGRWAPSYSNLPALAGLTVGVGRAGVEVWTWGGAKLYRSAAGAALTAVRGVTGVVRTVDVSTGLVSVFFTGGSSRLVSTDDGKSWGSLPAPQDAMSATHGPLPGLVAVSGDLPNVEIDPPTSTHRKPFDASPLETNVTNLQMSLAVGASGFVLYGATADDIFRLRLPSDFYYRSPSLPPVAPAKPVRVQARVPELRTPELSPDLTTVTLAPHERRKVPYRLLLPPTPTPLDVYFMTDSTGSMADTIGSVQSSIQQIVDDLTASGIDVHFGVADFRDYPMENGLLATDDWAYRRDRAVGPVDDAFGQALQSIHAGSGTLDQEDSGLEAIYQAATGAGRHVLSDPSGASDIAASQDARFRPNAVKVIVVAADAYFRHPEGNPGWPGPSLATVQTTLAGRGIHLVGLDVNTGSGQDPGSDMRALAAASHTFAGPAGVDCDGDGVPDIRAGDPLVCPYVSARQESIAPAFLGLLDSLRDLKPVSLNVVGPRDVVRPLAPTTFPAVNVKARNTLGVPLEFRCDPPRFGRTTTVRVVAAVAARQVASLPVTVKCLAPAPLPPVAPLLAIPPAAAIAAVPPAPPAQPNPNPNPNPNPQPQTQTNPAAASQEDEVQQLAFAEEGLLPDEPDLAMSSLRPSSWSAGSGSSRDRGAVYVLAAAGLLAVGAACRMRVSGRLSWQRSS
jgi:photosystem II stability/assembly factor-like uncharacterized protein